MQKVNIHDIEVQIQDIELHARRLPRRADVYDVKIVGDLDPEGMIGYSFTRGDYRITIVNVMPYKANADGSEIANIAVDVEPKSKQLREGYARSCAYHDSEDTPSSLQEFLPLWTREGAEKLFAVKGQDFGFFRTEETMLAIEGSYIYL